MAPRDGMKDLFMLCKKKDVPISILSAGIKNIIDHFCTVHQLHPAHTISTELLLDENNIITGWKPGSMIHVLNKNEKSHTTLSYLTESRPHIILLGDTLDDAYMASGTDTVLRVLIDDPRDDDMKHDDPIYQQKAKERFDILIPDGSLEPIVSLIASRT